VLGDRLVGMEIERDDERSGVIRSRERSRLPATRGEAKRRVLELGLGRRQQDGELAEDLRVGVEGVARRTPVLVANGRPVPGHDATVHRLRENG
jgi:hypothetical protein